MSRYLRQLPRRSLLALALCAAAGCTPRPSDSTSGPPRAGRQSDFITSDEIAKVNASNTYHAIELLRPTFLRSRGPTSVTRSLAVVAYVNGQRWGEVTSLRSLPVNDVVSIRRLSASEAQSRYGVDNTAGAIEVSTRSSGRP